jgi:DMSO reductase family type II enzyme heme b subunit
MATLTAKRVEAPSQALLDLDAPQWGEIAVEPVPLEPSPLETQPSDYVIAAWQNRPYGVLTEVRVRQLHNGEALFFLLEWDDAQPDTRITNIDTINDAAAIIFPMKEDAPLLVMGSEDQPVNVWFWRADWERPRNITAVGHSTSVRLGEAPLVARSAWRDGVWRVVIARPFQVDWPVEEAVALSPGVSVRVSVAVWDGSNQERGGIKAISSIWHQLNVEP